MRFSLAADSFNKILGRITSLAKGSDSSVNFVLKDEELEIFYCTEKRLIK